MADLNSATMIDSEHDHNCFGCGRLNAHGLQLTFVEDERGGVRTGFVPCQRFEGYDGMVHGGVISTVLDEVMAWSLYRHQIWAVTAELTVRYRMPLAVGESTYSVGWKVRRRRRRVDMAAELRRDADGALLAQATAVFIEVSADQADAWRQRYLGERDEVWSMK